MPVLLGYTSQVTAQQEAAALNQTTWTMSRGWSKWRLTNWWRCHKIPKA